MIDLKPTYQTKKNLLDIYNLEHYFHKGLRNALFDIGRKGALDASDLINNDGRTGRVYFINGVAHQASAPGESPANMTGRLKREMDYDVYGSDEVEWGSKTPYGKWLEEGTQKMAARPYLSIVNGRLGGEAEVFLGGRVDDAIKRRS